MLHYWHIDEVEDGLTGEKCQIAHGTVTGHTRLMDSVYIHTSEVKEVLINTDTKEAEIHTKIVFTIVRFLIVILKSRMSGQN